MDIKQAEQMHAAKMQAQCGAAMQGQTVASDLDMGRPCLRERVELQRAEASRASRKVDRLGELAYLLEKNPEVARILDLLEEVRG